MTLATLKPGVRQKVYIGGWSLDNSPSVFDPSEEAAETSQRLADSTYFTEYANLWNGCPGRITKRDWQLAFEAPSSDDLLHLRMLAAGPLTYDFCPWLPEAEHWELPTSSGYSNTASRRNAVSVIAGGLVPTGDWTAHFIGETTGTQYAVSWGSPDAVSPWRQTFTVTGMSSEEPGWLVYWPVFRVKIEKPKIDFSLAHMEKHVLSLKEI